MCDIAYYSPTLIIYLKNVVSINSKIKIVYIIIYILHTSSYISYIGQFIEIRASASILIGFVLIFSFICINNGKNKKTENLGPDHFQKNKTIQKRKIEKKYLKNVIVLINTYCIFNINFY